jgi:hypothetical protein
MRILGLQIGPRRGPIALTDATTVAPASFAITDSLKRNREKAATYCLIDTAASSIFSEFVRQTADNGTQIFNQSFICEEEETGE